MMIVMLHILQDNYVTQFYKSHLHRLIWKYILKCIWKQWHWKKTSEVAGDIKLTNMI